MAGLPPLLGDSQLGGGQQLSDSELSLLQLLRQNSASTNNLQGLGTSSLGGLGSSSIGGSSSLGGLGNSNSFSGLGGSSLGGLGGTSLGGLGSSSFTGSSFGGLGGTSSGGLGSSSLGGSSRQQQLPALGSAFQATPRPGSGSGLTSATSLGSSLSSAASLLSSSQPSSSSSLFPSSRPASASALLPSRPSLTFDDSVSQRGQQQQQEAGSLQFQQHERDSLIGHLIGLEQSGSKLVLTPRQRQALEEEARVRLVASPSPSRAPASASAASRNNVFSSLGATQARDSLLSSFGNRQQQGFGSLPGEELINNKPLILLANKISVIPRVSSVLLPELLARPRPRLGAVLAPAAGAGPASRGQQPAASGPGEVT